MLGAVALIYSKEIIILITIKINNVITHKKVNGLKIIPRILLLNFTTKTLSNVKKNNKSSIDLIFLISNFINTIKSIIIIIIAALIRIETLNNEIEYAVSKKIYNKNQIKQNIDRFTIIEKKVSTLLSSNFILKNCINFLLKNDLNKIINDVIIVCRIVKLKKHIPIVSNNFISLHLFFYKIHKI